MGVRAESITYVCDGCKIEETVSGKGTKEGFRPNLGLPVGWENVNSRKHEYRLLCYGCFQRQEDISKTKVISFMDSDGHTCVIDVTEPRSRVQVFKDILCNAHFPEGKKIQLLSEANRLLSADDTTVLQFLALSEQLIDAVNEADLDDVCSGRDGLRPFTPRTSW